MFIAPYDGANTSEKLFENLISKNDLSKKLGISVGFINKWMPLGLPYYKLGRLVRFNWLEVVGWLERRHHAQ